MRIRARLRLGVYWDERNFERRCVILEFGGRRVNAYDAVTREPIADPPAAIPLDRTEPHS